MFINFKGKIYTKMTRHRKFECIHCKKEIETDEYFSANQYGRQVGIACCNCVNLILHKKDPDNYVQPRVDETHEVSEPKIPVVPEEKIAARIIGEQKIPLTIKSTTPINVVKELIECSHCKINEFLKVFAHLINDENKVIRTDLFLCSKCHEIFCEHELVGFSKYKIVAIDEKFDDLSKPIAENEENIETSSNEEIATSNDEENSFDADLDENVTAGKLMPSREVYILPSKTPLNTFPLPEIKFGTKELYEWDGLENLNYAKLVGFKFKDGEIHKIKNWKDLTQEILKIAFRQHSKAIYGLTKVNRFCLPVSFGDELLSRKVLSYETFNFENLTLNVITRGDRYYICDEVMDSDTIEAIDYDVFDNTSQALWLRNDEDILLPDYLMELGEYKPCGFEEGKTFHIRFLRENEFNESFIYWREECFDEIYNYLRKENIKYADQETLELEKRKEAFLEALYKWRDEQGEAFKTLNYIQNCLSLYYHYNDGCNVPDVYDFEVYYINEKPKTFEDLDSFDFNNWEFKKISGDKSFNCQLCHLNKDKQKIYYRYGEKQKYCCSSCAKEVFDTSPKIVDLPIGSNIYFTDEGSCPKCKNSSFKRTIFSLHNDNANITELLADKCNVCGASKVKNKVVLSYCSKYKEVKGISGPKINYGEKFTPPPVQPVPNAPKYPTVIPDVDKDTVEIYERTGFFFCRDNNHGIKDVYLSLLVNTRSKGFISIDAIGLHCPKCRRYFILESILKEVERNGNVINYIHRKTWNKAFKPNKPDLPEESTLHKMGYHAHAGSDELSTSERWTILHYAYNAGILTKNEILAFLDRRIKMGMSKGHDKAVSKWDNDRRHMQDYKGQGIKVTNSNKKIF